MKLKIYVLRESLLVKAGFKYNFVIRVLRPEVCHGLTPAGN